MLIDNQENGNYTAHWVPTVPGVYGVQLYVDGRHTDELHPRAHKYMFIDQCVYAVDQENFVVK